MDILRMAGDVFKDVRRQTEMSDVPAGTPGRFAGQGQVINALKATMAAGANPIGILLAMKKMSKSCLLLQRTT